MSISVLTFKVDFDSFLELYDDDLYAIFMETGAYYDTEREAFDETQYEDYMQNRGFWSNSS